MNLSIQEIEQFKELCSQYKYKELLHWHDIILIPFFSVLIYALLNNIKKKQPLEIQKYFLPAYFVRIVAIAIFLFHHIVIYKGGVDSFTYFWSANELNYLAQIRPAMYFDLLFNSNGYNSNITDELSQFLFTKNEPLVIKITSILNFISFRSFVVSSLLAGLFAFGGTWQIFKVLYKEYPTFHRGLAVTCLFIPSVLIWSSTISKEIFCFGAMGYFFHSFYMVFLEKQRILQNTLIMFLMAMLLVKIKIYIILSFIPAILLFLLLKYLFKIQIALLRYSALPIVIFIVGLVVYYSLNSFSTQLQEFSLDHILDNARNTYIYLTQEGFAESRYTLGTFDPSFSGALKLLPAGLNVTLFRPYFWEANKPITLVASLESSFTFMFTLFVIFKTGFLRFWGIVIRNPIVIFSLLFAISFSAIVGITSGNFGTLMRYKIPMMPFYYSALWIVYSSSVRRQENVAIVS